jgi:hypothetical protein
VKDAATVDILNFVVSSGRKSSWKSGGGGATWSVREAALVYLRTGGGGGAGGSVAPFSREYKWLHCMSGEIFVLGSGLSCSRGW